MQDQSALEKVLAACHHPQSLSSFARLFLSSLSSYDVERLSADDLVGAIRYAHGLLNGHTQSHVNLLNPRFEELGWQSDATLCVVHHPDMPFLVDSVRIALAGLGVDVHLQANLIFSATRDKDHQLLEIQTGDFSSEAALESMVWLEIDRTTEPENLQRIKLAIQQTLETLKTVVTDFPAMHAHTLALAQAFSASGDSQHRQAGHFLNWLCDDHFTFLGSEYHPLDGHTDHPHPPLGLSRKAYLCPTVVPSVEEASVTQEGPLSFGKAPEKSPIHRAVYPDVIAVADIDSNGRLRGEHRLIGLFTARVYLRPAHEIPLIADKLTAIEQASGFVPGSHNAKVLQQILQVYPRDELFQASTEFLAETATEIVKLHERNTIRLFMNRDRFGFFCSALLYIPRDLYTTESRIKIQNTLSEAIGADEASFSTYFSESIYARVQMIFRLKPEAIIPDVRTLEQKATDVVLRWEDQLQHALSVELDEERAHVLFARYGRAFSAGYREDFAPRRAVFDIEHMEQLTADQPVAVALYQDVDSVERYRLKIYALDTPIPLSDALPLIEHLGAWVISETPYTVDAKEHRVWVHDYQMQLTGSPALGNIRTLFEDAFLAAWSGVTESDGFSRLVVLSELSWRDITLLRAWSHYLKQLGFELSLSWMADTLVQYPQLARELVALFYARFDESRSYNADLEQKLAHHFLDRLDAVAGLNEDRLMRRLLQVVQSTQRTNFFIALEGQRLPYVSFKLIPGGIDDVPKPVPYREIYVYSARVEGVHLRGGPVARGGLRWSDRGEDYRTEVLGLVKAQQVKNSVIVPVGAKGGFYPKQLPAGDRDAVMAEGVACYQLFISGLLDLTDNVVGGEIVSPEGVRCHDAADPYLVVAADKGTATFSDIANALSEARGFWLGDAFASGGSSGYDHKKMGITARGAWVSVERHFHELGRDCQTESFSCVAIGDMSGDVFGNGLLRSKMTRLIAAFNHQHIFIDPTPDSDASFAERERLFQLPRSGWGDYDTAKISAGGGVFSRAAKHISLSAEAAEALGTEPGPRTPSALIQQILKAPVDLLWNGGIGTYVKAMNESHLEVGDKANDAVRVDGHMLRARVVGEGGNLGLTQRGRIEAALHGVRLNTDFIDNAGGVDCSDHEVNIKIHLNRQMAEGDLTRKQRDRVLAQMTDEVAELVLSNNREQTQAVSLARLHAEDSPEDLIRFMQSQAEKGLLDRDLEFLPSDDALKDRLLSGKTLTGPELSVLISYAKNELKHAFAEPALAQDPVLLARTLEGFPESLVARDPEALLSHPLAVEIAATQWANWMVNTMGITFALRMQQASGRSMLDVLKAFAVASALYQLADHWQGIDQAHAMEARAQLTLKRHLHRLVRRATRWLLRNRTLEQGVGAEIERYADIMETLLHDGIHHWPNPRQEVLSAQCAQWEAQGVPEATARVLVTGVAYHHLISIAEVVRQSERPVEEVAPLVITLVEILGLEPLARLINDLTVSNTWEAMAREAFRDDLVSATQNMVSALANQPGSLEDLLQRALEVPKHTGGQWRRVLDQLNAAHEVSFPMLAVALRELKVLETSVSA